MAGVFRRPFHRGPPRRIVHGVAGVVDVQAPGLHRPKHRPMVRRDPVPRKPRTVPLLGVRQPGMVISRMVMERTRKILRARVRPLERVFIPTFQPAAGATPFPAKPAAQRLPIVAAARRVPIVPARIPPVPSSTPFPPRGSQHRKPVRMPVMAKRIVPGVVPGPGPTPFRPRQPAAKVPRHHPVRPHPLRGSLFVPGGVVLFIRQPRAIRPRHMFRLARLLITAPPITEVIVCTDGVWSATISFLPCDDLRITIDGPAADDVKIAATMELEE